MKLIGPILIFFMVLLAIAAVLVIVTLGFGWVLAYTVPGLERGQGLIAAAILALGSIHLLAKIFSMIQPVELPDDESEGDGHGEDPDDKPSIVIVPPSFPFGPERTRTRRKRKQ